MPSRKRGAPSADAIAAAVRAATAAILEDEPNGILAVNDGRCEDLAQDVFDRLGVEEGRGIHTFEISNITEGYGGDFDRKLIAKEFPTIVPPPLLGWDDMDELGITDVAHVWLSSGGRHYDCDVPDGVENPFDLPLMRRCLAGSIRDMRPDDEERLKADPWWSASFALHDELLEWRAACEASEGPRGP